MKSSLLSFSYRLLSRLIIAGGTLLSVQGAHAQIKGWPVPIAAAAIKNPTPATPVSIAAGKATYKLYCAPCHGNNGRGDGPAAASLNPKPADHTSSLLLKETDGSLFYRISEGHTPMPQYKTTLSEQQRWELVDYIRTLCKEKK